MKRYKFIKPLPLIKTGTEIPYDETTQEYRLTLPDQNFPTYVFAKEEMPRLAAEGWIEEIIPRTVFVEYKKGENGMNYLNDVSDNIEHYEHHKTQPIFSVAKFIEVID